MSEGMAPEEIAKEAENFNAERASSRESEPEQKLEARLEDDGVAQIYPEFAGTEYPVRLEFRRAPELGTVMQLEKIPEEPGGPGFKKFYAAEEPVRGVKKREGVVYLRAIPLDEMEARRAETPELQIEDMRGYLTTETLTKMKLSQPESPAPLA